jgi:hypothetical protein
MTMIAGLAIRIAAASFVIVATVPTTCRWLPSVPSWTTLAGIAGDMPASASWRTMCSSLAMPI